MRMPGFKVISEYEPAGDQANAIHQLSAGLGQNIREQILKGVTGSGKTFTMAKIIERIQLLSLIHI